MPPPSVDWLIISLYPDVCETKGVPVPYVIVSSAEVVELESRNVALNGQLAMTCASLTRTCQGDEAADAGVKSGTVGGMCQPIEKEERVHINGHGALHEGDLIEMNQCNTVGKVILVPAISKPNTPGELSEAEMDRAIAGLIVQTLQANGGDPVASQHMLTQMRNLVPSAEFYNNPVVVAAEHYFVAYNMCQGVGGTVKILVWEMPKFVAQETVDKLGKIIFPTMNQDHPASEADMTVVRWSFRGQKMGSMGKLGISSIAKKLAEMNNPPKPSVTDPTRPADLRPADLRPWKNPPAM